MYQESTMKVTIVGAQIYKVRTEHNIEQYEKIMQKMHWDGAERQYVAETDELIAEGVDPLFLSYVLRNNYIRVVN